MDIYHIYSYPGGQRLKIIIFTIINSKNRLKMPSTFFTSFWKFFFLKTLNGPIIYYKVIFKR